MKNEIKAGLLLAINATVGVSILMLSQRIKLPTSIPSPLLTLTLFLLLNIGQVRLFRLSPEWKIFWSAAKIGYLFIGCFAGMLIACTPLLVGLITCKGSFATPCFPLAGLTATSILMTLVIVSWEELWFRSMVLNYCHRHLSIVAISLTNGILFMLVHALNPAIHLLEEGPGLFFAGALLTMLYFHFRNIWLPLGMHWGNNLLASKVATQSQDGVCGNDAHVRAGVLAVVFVYFVVKSLRKSRLNSKAYE